MIGTLPSRTAVVSWAVRSDSRLTNAPAPPTNGNTNAANRRPDVRMYRSSLAGLAARSSDTLTSVRSAAILTTVAVGSSSGPCGVQQRHERGYALLFDVRVRQYVSKDGGPIERVHHECQLRSEVLL